MKLLKKISAFILLGALITSCGEQKPTDAPNIDNSTVAVDTTVVEAQNIVGVVEGNQDFSTFLKVVTAAGLVDTLNSEGPFTVFAPNDAAFAKLPTGILNGLLEIGSAERLKSVLTYHVIQGKLDAATLRDMIKKGSGKYSLKTIEGGTIILSLKDEKVMLTDVSGLTAMVIVADLPASNGIIHTIDTVIMPK